MKKAIKEFSKIKIPKRLLPYVVLAISVTILSYSIWQLAGASSKGGSIGEDIGTRVGKTIGSFEGITKGLIEGREAGKKEGLSAEDSEAEIANEIHKVKNLEVLVASVKVSDMHTIGEKEKYAALYLIKGEVIFSVDLESAKITLKDDKLDITLPLPIGKFVIDQSQIDKAAEYQEHYFSGSAEDGFDAYLNTMNKLHSVTADELDNYNVLMDAAKDSAIKQVSQLATSANIKKRKVQIQFEEEQ